MSMSQMYWKYVVNIIQLKYLCTFTYMNQNILYMVVKNLLNI